MDLNIRLFSLWIKQYIFLNVKIDNNQGRAKAGCINPSYKIIGVGLDPPTSLKHSPKPLLNKSDGDPGGSRHMDIYYTSPQSFIITTLGAFIKFLLVGSLY